MTNIQARVLIDLDLTFANKYLSKYFSSRLYQNLSLVDLKNQCKEIFEDLTAYLPVSSNIILAVAKNIPRLAAIVSEYALQRLSPLSIPPGT